MTHDSRPIPRFARFASVCALAVASAAPAAAAAPPAGWFVDSRNGNDANDGSYERPWRTLARLSSVQASAARPINLRCDGVWRETLKLDAGQLAPGAVIQPYGSCAKSTATLNGSDLVSGGWGRSGSVWQRNVGAGRGITQLFVNGRAHRVARWPDAGGPDSGFALSDTPATANNGSLLMQAADAQVLAGKDIANAGLYLRTGGAASQVLTVKSADSGSRVLRFNQTASRNIAGGHGYVLTGKRWMLDAPGEYLYDDTTGELYVYPQDGSDLNAATVEVSVRDSGLEIGFTSGVTVRGIGFVKARRNGVQVYEAPKTVLQSITAIDNGRAGAAVISTAGSTGSADSVVADGVFVRNALYGIDASGATRVTLRNNSVKDTGGGAFLGQPMAGIWAGPGNLVQGNVVQRSALTGIRFEGRGGTQVVGNVVTDSCQRFSDCGAIYTWNGPKRSDWKAGQSSQVRANVVARAPANLDGSGPSAPYFNVGIYYDSYSASSVASGNWASDMAIGIKLHNASNISVSGNRVARATSAALWANMDDASVDYMAGNVFEGNQLVPASTVTGSFPDVPQPQPAYAVWFWHKTLGTASITGGGNVFRGNDLVQFNDPAIPVAWFHGADGDSHLLGSAWADLSTGDTLRSPAAYALYRPTLGDELLGNGRFDAGLDGWDAWFANVGGLLGTVASAALPGCSGPCARFAALSANDVLISPPFAMAPGAMYQVSFTASFLTPGSASRPGFVGSSSNAGTIGALSSSAVLNGLPGQTLAYSALVTAASGEPTTLRLAAMPGTTLGWDNVSLRRVNGFAVAQVDEWIRTAVADRSALSLGCASFGWPAGCTLMDVDGRVLAQPYTLAPYSAKTILRGDSGWRTR